jgi:16S rRNA (guanine(1405)-N(7))-methyltransferase
MGTIPPAEETAPVAQVVAHVRAARKYRGICADTVWRIAAQEWTKHGDDDATPGTIKRVVKAVKSRLHQAYGAYQARVNYDQAYRALATAYAEGTDEAIRATSHRLLSLHSSTRERLSILHRFYSEIVHHTGVPGSVLDLACGLNPLSLPWMGLGNGTTYHAYDIDAERIAFLARYLELAGLDGHAHLQDVIASPPTERADMALLLKSFTCLERQHQGSTRALLDGLAVRYVVVSFPVKSLGRRDKGMLTHYARTFDEMTAGQAWTVTRLNFATELVYLVDKR